MAKHKTKPGRKKVISAAQHRILQDLIPDAKTQAAFRTLAEDGLIELPTKPFGRKGALAYKPIKIKGKTLSETVIEERR